MDDPHEVLGVSRDATAEQVGRRFRELVPRHHADRAVHATPQERRVAHERMSSITEAFRMLNDVAELMRYRRLVPAREARTPRSWVVTGCTSGLVIRRPGVGSNPRRATRTSTSAVGPRASSSSATAPTNPACGPPARSRHAAGGVGDDWCRPCHRPARRWASGGEAEAGRWSVDAGGRRRWSAPGSHGGLVVGRWPADLVEGARCSCGPCLTGSSRSVPGSPQLIVESGGPGW